MSQCASSSWLMPCPLRVGHHSTRKPIFYRASSIAMSNRSDSVKQNHAFEWERSEKATIKRFKWQFSKKEIYIGEWVKFLVHGFSHRHILTDSDRFWQRLFPSSTATIGDGIPSLHHVAHQHLCQLGPSHATLGFGCRAGLVARCRCHGRVPWSDYSDYQGLVAVGHCRVSEILLHHLSHIWASRSLIDCG